MIALTEETTLAKRKRGRPKGSGSEVEKKKGQLQFRVPDSVTDRMDRVARINGITRADLAKRIIIERLPIYERAAELLEKGEPPDAEN